jgi:hypothetical protein
VNISNFFEGQTGLPLFVPFYFDQHTQFMLIEQKGRAATAQKRLPHGLSFPGIENCA